MTRDGLRKHQLAVRKKGTLRVQVPPEKVFWGGFGGLNPFSGGTWTLRDSIWQVFGEKMPHHWRRSFVTDSAAGNFFAIIELQTKI